MKTIETIKADINNQLDHAKMKADAVKLQCTLGKADLNDIIQDKQKAVAEAAITLSEHLSDIGAAAGEVKEDIAIGVDKLNVQIALGEMEGKEVIEQVKSDVVRQTNEFEKALDKAEIHTDEHIENVKSKVSDYLQKASQLKASIEAKVERINR